MTSKLKIAITGHTKGLGAALYEHFINTGHEVSGFSRSLGYILPFKMQEVLTLADDADVFINNALPVTAQVSLLYQLYHRWKDKQKIILTVGSHTTDDFHSEPNQYYAEKFGLDAACKNLRKLNPVCKIILIRPSYFASERVLRTVKPEHYIEMDEMCKLVDYVISSKIHIEDMLFQQGRWQTN